MAREMIEMPTPLKDIPEEAEGLALAHWNKIYLCYCFSQGEGNPLRMVIRDAALEPDDYMRRFLSWLPKQWARYMNSHEPHWRMWDRTYRTHYRRLHEKAFTDWLWQRWAMPKPQGPPVSEPKET